MMYSAPFPLINVSTSFAHPDSESVAHFSCKTSQVHTDLIGTIRVHTFSILATDLHLDLYHDFDWTILSHQHVLI